VVVVVVDVVVVDVEVVLADVLVDVLVVVVTAERAGSTRVRSGSSGPPTPVANAAPAMPTTANAPPMMAITRRGLVPSASCLPDGGAVGPSSSSLPSDRRRRCR
jgi:hypothetical protein